MENLRGQFQIDFLKSVRANGGRIVEARFSLQRGVFKFVEPMYLLVLEQQGVRSLQELSWTPELEEYLLLHEELRMSKAEDEGERFAAILLNNLRTAEGFGGKDFSHAVLIDVLRRRAEYEPLRPLLDRASTPAPSATSKHYGDGALFIRDSIDGLHNTALLSLKYTPDEVEKLMLAALEIVLDETFHFSAADRMRQGS